MPSIMTASNSILDRLRMDSASSKRAPVLSFHRDGWARPWPVGPEMLCYMLSHEAHHRGQVCMLAHQLGFPLPNKVASGLWNWEKLWNESATAVLQNPSTDLP